MDHFETMNAAKRQNIVGELDEYTGW